MVRVSHVDLRHHRGDVHGVLSSQWVFESHLQIQAHLTGFFLVGVLLLLNLNLNQEKWPGDGTVFTQMNTTQQHYLAVAKVGHQAQTSRAAFAPPMTPTIGPATFILSAFDRPPIRSDG